MIEGFKGYRGSERGVKETIVLYLKVNVKALKIKGSYLAAEENDKKQNLKR